MIGKKVADFTAPATGGEFRLSDHKGEAVVLYFYPKDNTPGCTTEGEQFRDAYKQIPQGGRHRRRLFTRFAQIAREFQG